MFHFMAWKPGNEKMSLSHSDLLIKLPRKQCPVLEPFNQLKGAETL